MNLFLDSALATQYHSSSQIARRMTEGWVERNMFCPRCGNLRLQQFQNNKPVADFFCPVCQCEYELKSTKAKHTPEKINDGAYNTMIQRITSNQNPDFFFMRYSGVDLSVKDFTVIPKHFFVPAMIEKRPPLPETAIRAGWTGCNILLQQIPEQGRIVVISDGQVHEMNEVVQQLNKSTRLETKDIDSRGWLMDVLRCVNQVPKLQFSLSEIYSFENALQDKHPENKHIKAKIRQQLQVLRNRGFLEFLGNGVYRKLL